MKNLIIINHPLVKRKLTILPKKALRLLTANSTIAGRFFQVLEMLAIERSGRSK